MLCSKSCQSHQVGHYLQPRPHSRRDPDSASSTPVSLVVTEPCVHALLVAGQEPDESREQRHEGRDSFIMCRT